jgi:hypothetical protein
MENTLLWGIVVLICGVFICSYGNILFRFVLAFAGFAIGFSLVMWVGGGLGDGLQILIAIVIGGVLAAVFYGIFRFALYIAGGLLGTVIMLALLGLFKLGGLDLGVFGWILAGLAAVAGGFFGHRLGDIIIVLATALAGAYFVVLGLGAIFRLSVDTENPLTLLGTSFPLILFLTIALISGLAQYQAFSFRRRILR